MCLIGKSETQLKEKREVCGFNYNKKSQVSDKKQKLLLTIIEINQKIKKGNGISRNSISLLQTRGIKFRK